VTSLAAVVGAALLKVLLAVGGAPPAASTETSSDKAGAAIELAVVGSEADLARVRVLVRPKPGSGAIRWRRLDSFRPPQILDAGDSSATRCWIDLGDARRAHLYFVGRSGTRFLIRDVELSGRFDELDLTSLAEVIDLSLAAVIDDERAGISRAEAEHLLAPPPAPSVAPAAAVVTAPPAARAPPPWSRSIRAGVFYAAQTFASSLPLVSGPGLIVSAPVIGGGRWQLGAWLAGQYQIAGDATGELASVRLATIATRAGACALWALGAPQSARWAIELRAGAGADTIHLQPAPGTNNSSAMLTPARWSTSLALTAAAGVATTFGGDRFRLGARLYADVLPIATHYDVAVDGQATTVVAPDRIRPGLAVDLTVALGSAR
jgi:hypothetical protein